MIAITRASGLPLADTPLAGGNLGAPKSGSRSAGYSLDLVGWVLAKPGPVQAVELHYEGISFARILQNCPRPDIAGLFDVPHAERSGFRGSVSLIGLPAEFELVLKAVLPDNRRVPFAVVHGRRDPLSTGYSPRVRPLMLSNLGRSGSTWLTHLLGCHPGILTYRPFRHEPRVGSYWVDGFDALAQPASYYQQIAPEVGGSFWWSGERRTQPPPDLGGDPDLERWLGEEAVERLGAFCQRSVDEFYLRVAAGQTKTQAAFFLERFYGTGARTPFVAWELYPNAREIFLVRDYRDVLCSILAFNAKHDVVLFGREKADSDEEYVRAHMAPNVTGLLKNWRLRKERAFLLRYEDLVLKPRSTLSELLIHMGVEGDEETVDHVLEEASRRHAGRQKEHKTTGEVSASVGRWRTELSEALKAACAESLWPVLREFGYEERDAPTAAVSPS